jgi:hypothetical protein
VATALGEGYVACLAAIGAIVEAVGAQVDVGLPFANGAVLLAIAVLLCLVALHADGGTGHETPPGRMYLRKYSDGKKLRSAVCSSLTGSRARDIFFRPSIRNGIRYNSSAN